jgi:H+/gluconate symporter-like permease
MLAVVLAGAMITCGGVSPFVAFFVLAPMAHSLLQAADIRRRLLPAAIILGTSTFTRSAMPGRRPFRTPFPCRSSEPRRSRRQASASSRRL